MQVNDGTYLEIKKQMQKYNEKNTNYIPLLVLGILLLPLIFSWLFVRKPHEYVADINNLPEPIQTSASGGIIMQVYGETVHIDFLAEYDIQGRVLAKHDYAEIFSKIKVLNKIGPKDFVLGWGILGRKENMDKFEWHEFGNRYVQASVKGEDNYYWFKETFGGSWGNAGLYYSNNHPILSTKKIGMLLKKIKVGDVIRIKGYLVDVHSDKGWRFGPSSLVRDDHGCEIIYVTNITWLKQK